MNISMRTSRAIELVESHAQQHLAEYNEQMNGWREAMQEFTDKLDAWSVASDTSPKPEEPVRPHDFSEEYTKLLDVLEAHALDLIELFEFDQVKIIHDVFPWSNEFFGNTAMYVDRQEQIRVRRKK